MSGNVLRKWLGLLIISSALITGCQQETTPVDQGSVKTEIENVVTSEDAVEDIGEVSFLSGDVVFSSKEKGRELIGTKDAYVDNFSQFDLESKILFQEKTHQGYLTQAMNSVLEWTPEEKAELKGYFVEIEDKVNELGLKFELPEEVHIIKSTCIEEGGAAGYTRENYIVLNQHMVNKDLVAHELFHIISRYNSEKANALYELLGFEEIENLEFPKELYDRMISNPDTPRLNYGITVDVASEEKLGVLMMYSNRPYEGGSFFEYFSLGLYFPEDKDAFTLDNMVSLEKTSNFYDQVGTNTTYNIHPEEISADHFKILLTGEYKDVPNPELIDGMINILK